MKPQDIIFLVILLVLLFKRRPEWLIWAGLVSLIISMPLFYFWIFFTAQRLVEYAAAFFLIAILLLLFKNSRK